MKAIKTVIFIAIASFIGSGAALAQDLFHIHIGKKHNTYRCDKVGVQKNKHHHFSKKERKEWASHVHTPDVHKIHDMNEKKAVEKIALATKPMQPEHLTPKMLEKPLDTLPLPDPVFFVYDSDALAFEDEGQIDLAIQHAQKGRKIQLEGHTDGNGSLKYNQKLSEKRANKIKKLMLERCPDLDETAISTIGYGKTHPAIENDSPQHRQENRRVVFLVMD